MEWNSEDFSFNNDLYMQNEELEHLLVDASPPTPLYEEITHSTVASNNSPISASSEPPSPPNCNVVLNNNQVDSPEQDPNMLELQSCNESKKNGGRKRTRGPDQAQEHVLSERKRRQLTAQLFISLSAMLPNLKKMDKSTILEEATKHMKELIEKVEALEEVAGKQNEELMAVVQGSKMVVDNDDDSSCIVEDVYVLSSGNNISNWIPEIEATVSYKTLILNLYCEKQRGILTKIIGEMEKHHIFVLHSAQVSLGNSTYKHTIVGQIKKRDKRHMKNLVVGLNSIIHAS